MDLASVILYPGGGVDNPWFHCLGGIPLILHTGCDRQEDPNQNVGSGPEYRDRRRIRFDTVCYPFRSNIQFMGSDEKWLVRLMAP